MNLRRLFDHRREDSWVHRFRLKRFAFIRSLLESVPRPMRIIDVGGTPVFWERMGMAGNDDVHITLVNLRESPVQHSNLKSVIGDGRDLGEFGENEFDVAFSNSVIEHVGDFSNQRRMANEIQRVARHYVVQTPNRYFPIEPHFLCPFFQFLPFWLRVRLAEQRVVKLGWYGGTGDRQKAQETVASICLLSKRQIRQLFPGCHIYSERFLGWPKSFIASAPRIISRRR